MLEGAPEFGAIGYGIQFGPNVFHVFDRLGLRDEVLAVADPPAALLMLDALDGKELIRIPTGASFRARFKHPYIVVHRIDVHNVLLDACRQHDAIELVPDAMVTGFEDRGDCVALATADGRTFSRRRHRRRRWSALAVSRQLVGDGEPHPVGYAAHRTIVPMAELKADVQRDCVVLWGGPGFHIVHYPLRHGTLFNVVAVFRTATHGEKGDAASHLAELRAQLPRRAAGDARAAGDDGCRAPLADRLSRSGAPLAPGPRRPHRRRRASRRCNRWRRAPAWRSRTASASPN